MYISCFLLSQPPHLALELFSNDGFTEGPANRALTTASPLVTACQNSHPRGLRPLGSTWLLVFFLYSPRDLFRHGYISHRDIICPLTNLKGPWSPCNYYNLANNKGNQISIDKSPFCWEARTCFQVLFKKMKLKGLLLTSIRNIGRMWERAETQTTHLLGDQPKESRLKTHQHLP